jgi:2-polyprenyl-3-methyl-5-hydroxy-6-metoxy-1,4-benzoquinol methylase
MAPAGFAGSHVSYTCVPRIVHRIGRRVDTWTVHSLPLLPGSGGDDFTKPCARDRITQNGSIEKPRSFSEILSFMSREPIGYDTKPDYYFEWPREEMAPFVPSDCRRMLEVGCGSGVFGRLLKQTRKIEVWGLEPVKSAAAKASDRLDHVVNGLFDPEIELPAGTFDCVVFNDVLEHMVAPEQALRYAKVLLTPGGTVVASIPNIRFLKVLWGLVVHGQWEYADDGVLDKTHLRFFTKSSIMKMFQSEGYSIENISGINAYRGPSGARRTLWGVYRLASALSPGTFGEMRFQQFAVVAKVAPPL